MKLNRIVAFIATGAVLAWQAGAQTYDTNNIVVQTFAGSGFSGYVDGVGQQTMFNNPLARIFHKFSMSELASLFLVVGTPGGTGFSKFEGRAGDNTPGP